jgi:hypothetical protein
MCGIFLLCATIDVAQVKPRAMHVSTEKAIALREKPPFDIIKVIVVPIAECQKEVL